MIQELHVFLWPGGCQVGPNLGCFDQMQHMESLGCFQAFVAEKP